MSNITSAIIAGTGVYQLPGLTLEPAKVDTPFGEAHVQRVLGHNLVFLTRHGADHSIPPHRINYRANMSALKILGVKRVLAAYAVGSLRRDLTPGGLCLLTDFLDFTEGRCHTYFEGGVSGLGHADMSEPYCGALRQQLLERAGSHNLVVKPQGTYVCTNGPRFESAAEIRMYAQFGADVVGMTGVPEVSLAKELGLHFAAVALSVNLAVGLEKSLTIVYEGMEETRHRLLQLFMDVLAHGTPGECGCETAVDYLQRPPHNAPPGYPQSP